MRSYKSFSLLLVFLISLEIAFSQKASFPGREMFSKDWHQIPISNSSFEEGEGNYPSHWDRWGKGEFFWSGEAFDGIRSAGLRKTDWSTGWRSQSFPVFAEYQNDYTWFYCEAYLKTKGASGRIHLSIAWYGEKGWLGNSRSPYFVNPDSEGWEPIFLYALPPKGATRGEIILRVDKEITGTVLYDAVRLYSLSFPISSTVEDGIASPYYAFISEYPGNPLTFEAYLQIALAEEDKNNYARAREIYETMGEIYSPLKPWALFRQVECSIKMKDYKKAKYIAEKVEKDFPFFKGEANYWLSEICKEEGNYKESLSYAMKSLEAANKGDWFLSRAGLNQAYALDLLGECEEALEKYKEVADRHIDQRPLALLGLGGRYFDLGKYDLALEIFKELSQKYKDIGLDDIEAEALLYIGRCYEHKLDYPAAIGAYSEVLKKKTTVLQKYIEKPIRQLSPEIVLARDSYQYLKLRIAYCYLQMGDLAKTYKLWEEIAESKVPGRDWNFWSIVAKRLLKSYKDVIKPHLNSELEHGSKVIIDVLGPTGIFEGFSVTDVEFKVDFRKGRVTIVYGTQCDESVKNIYKNLGESLRLYRASLPVALKPDSEVNIEDLKEKDLVLIGTPSSNKILAMLKDSLPIKIEEKRIVVANRTYMGERLGVIMIAPSPYNPQKFVLVYCAFDPSLLTGLSSIFYGYSDYIVFTSSRSDRLGIDVIEEGYFWKVSPKEWVPFSGEALTLNLDEVENQKRWYIASLSKAKELYAKAEYDLALQTYESILKESQSNKLPDEIHKEILWFMARCYEHKLDFSSALNCYKKILQRSAPGEQIYNLALIGICNCYLQISDFRDSIVMLERAIKNIPRVDAWYPIYECLLASIKDIFQTPTISAKLETKAKARVIGPINSIYEDFTEDWAKGNVLLIYETQTNQQGTLKCEELAKRWASVALQEVGSPTFRKAVEISHKDLEENNIILISCDPSNRILESFKDYLPINIEKEVIRVGNRVYKGREIGVISISPNPLNQDKFLLIIFSFDSELIEEALSLGGATDYIIFAKRPKGASMPLILENGFFKKHFHTRWEAFLSKQGKGVKE
ncbi:tetratricopeptide repeat protein [bacterium]|nr:tetratricopeptide repeat protein [bacterium]